MECPTVKVKSGVDWTPYFIINEHDFDATKHELYGAAETPAHSIHETGGAAEAAVWGDAPAAADKPKRGRK